MSSRPTKDPKAPHSLGLQSLEGKKLLQQAPSPIARNRKGSGGAKKESFGGVLQNFQGCTHLQIRRSPRVATNGSR